MPEKKFDVRSLLDLQALLWPLVRALGGPDVPNQFIAPTAPVLDAVELTLREAADVVRAAAQGLRDGLLTSAEIDQVLLEAGEAGAAVRALWERINPPEAPAAG